MATDGFVVSTLTYCFKPVTDPDLTGPAVNHMMRWQLEARTSVHCEGPIKGIIPHSLSS
jgi:hypothetical protein